MSRFLIVVEQERNSKRTDTPPRSSICKPHKMLLLLPFCDSHHTLCPQSPPVSIFAKQNVFCSWYSEDVFLWSEKQDLESISAESQRGKITFSFFLCHSQLLCEVQIKLSDFNWMSWSTVGDRGNTHTVCCDRSILKYAWRSLVNFHSPPFFPVTLLVALLSHPCVFCSPPSPHRVSERFLEGQQLSWTLHPI